MADDLPSIDEVRPEVRRFAQYMEAVLRAHDDKGGWRHMDPMWLASRAVEECGELVRSLRERNFASDPRSMLEAVDVANMAMMVWDVLRSEKARSLAIDEHMDARGERSGSDV